MKKKTLTAKEIFAKYDKGYEFNSQINLYDTVQVNENFFIGNQWEGVEANGLPTPTFNMMKQVVNFQVSTITSDNMMLKATAMPGIGRKLPKEVERVCNIVTDQYLSIMERSRIVTKMREFMRNAAVDGDGCMHFWFDPTVENGQLVKGEIKAEVLENTRVHFGNPNSREVQTQPYIIIVRRETVEDVRWRAEKLRESGDCELENEEDIKADTDKFQTKYDSYTDDKVTVLTYYYRDRESGKIWCAEALEAGLLRKPYDTGYTLYPIIWQSWDYVQDCYHGQAMITGLLPNQKFVNKMFALVGISLTTMSFPKVIYDKTKIKSWDGSVGSAVGVNGNVDGVAKTIDGATVNPQIGQFMELCIDKTKSFLGASDVALGDSRPDNTSAIIALQRAANTPMEITKQGMYQQIEDMGLIFCDIMAAKYGTRTVSVNMEMDIAGQQPLGMQLPAQQFEEVFDFGTLRQFTLSVKQDAGASSYWSEIASMQTLDNLLMNKHITLLQYLERVPAGYISKKQELIDEMKAAAMPQPGGMPGGMGMMNANEMPVAGGPGNGALQRALNREGV
jgi:hypothetical protein